MSARQPFPSLSVLSGRVVEVIDHLHRQHQRLFSELAEEPSLSVPQQLVLERALYADLDFLHHLVVHCHRSYRGFLDHSQLYLLSLARAYCAVQRVTDTLSLRVVGPSEVLCSWREDGAYGAYGDYGAWVISWLDGEPLSLGVVRAEAERLCAERKALLDSGFDPQEASRAPD